MSVGVIIAAVIINIKPTWTLADPLCTYLFSVIIACTSIPVFSINSIVTFCADDWVNKLLEIDMVKHTHCLRSLCLVKQRVLPQRKKKVK
jgi:Co/Zn/Cd efflux system component